MVLLNFLKGNVSPVCTSLSILGEWPHFSSHVMWSVTWKACLMAGMLLGRGDLSGCGRAMAALDLPSAAFFFANWSASSLRLMLLWLEIQLMVRLGYFL